MNKQSPKNEPVHYAWIILLSCCALSGAALGVIINCKGLFIAPVCAELGCSSSRFTLYTTFYGVCSAATLPVVNRVFQRLPIRVVLTAALLVLCLSTSWMGAFHRVELWYIAGALQGISGAFLLFVPVPMLLNDWFFRRRGFALGISAVASGLMGAAANLLLNALIADYGWRTAYLIQGIAAFLLASPFTAFLIVRKPQERGLCAYGQAGTAQASPPAVSKAAVPAESRLQLFPYCICFTVISTFCTAYVQHFSNYTVSIGLSRSVGAAMVSVCMAGAIMAKAAFGAASDYVGNRRISCLSLLMAFTGFIVLALGGGWKTGLFLAAFLSGSNNANLSVLVPLAVSEIAPNSQYDRILAQTTVGTMLTGAVSTLMISVFYDYTGSYTAGFLFGAILQVISLIAALKIFRPSPCR